MDRRLYQKGAVVLLGLFFVLALSSATLKSATTDEGYHLSTGYSYLQSFYEHPRAFTGRPYPHLAGVWASLPLLLEHDALSPGAPGDNPKDFWGYVYDRLYIYYGTPVITRYTFIGRIQILFLGVLLGALVFYWAKERFGALAGLLACFLYVFSPNILAHSRLITTDIAMSLACLLIMYVTQQSLRRATLPRTILLGLMLGGALLIKYSTLLLAPAIGLLLLLAAWRRNWYWSLRPDLPRHKALLRAAGMMALICGLAFLIVWAGFEFEIKSLQRADFPWPVPAASYVDEIIYHTVEQRPAFLLGQQWEGGRWYYFFATLLFKTPPPMLFLLLITPVWAIFRRRLDEQLPLIIFPLLYFSTSLTRGFNIGHRHLLPLLPFAFVFVSQIVLTTPERSKTRRLKICGALLAAWYLVIALWIYPNYLSYFNLFAGGPSRGYQVLLDSNLDWGQDLIQLRRYMERARVDEVWLSEFTNADPALYGVRYRPLPNWDNMALTPAFHYLDPDPGVYVISATFLQGMYLPNPSTFNWFLHRDAIDQIGHSMLVYRVEKAPSPTWLGMCQTPEAALSLDEIAAGFGARDLRVVSFDCRSSSVIPGGRVPGWYVVPAAAENSARGAPEWLQEASVEFEQYDHARNKVFTVYKLTTLPEPPSFLGAAQFDADPSILVPPQFPLHLDGPATFLGYQLGIETVGPGDVLTVKTYWEARAAPQTTLSISVHLIAPGGQVWSAEDALDFAASQWQAGDIFMQQHSLEIPSNAPPGTYWITSGLYDLDRGAWYPARAPAMEAEMFLLGSVQVE